MKGTFFQKPLEFNLRIEGETWNQADAISGELIAKNHGAEPVALETLGVGLAHGELKKVRLKSPEAFDVLASQKFEGGQMLEPGKEARLSWKFETDRNCPISDSTKSLFIVYGQGDATEKLGQLQLTIRPYWIIQEFLSTVTTQFRFVVKTLKWSKGRVEAKLAPPDSKAFAMLEHLTLSFRFEEETLDVKYVFQVKKLEATAANVDVKKDKREVEQSFAKHEYLTPSGRIGFERLEAAIREALQVVEAKVTF